MSYSSVTKLIALYRFNSGSESTLYDYSGNQNHGTIYGASWEENIYGCTDSLALNYDDDANTDNGSCIYPYNGDYSLNFDGIDDWIELPDIDLLDNYTLSITYNPISHDDYNSLFFFLYSNQNRILDVCIVSQLYYPIFSHPIILFISVP